MLAVDWASLRIGVGVIEISAIGYFASSSCIDLLPCIIIVYSNQSNFTTDLVVLVYRIVWINKIMWIIFDSENPFRL